MDVEQKLETVIRFDFNSSVHQIDKVLRFDFENCDQWVAVYVEDSSSCFATQWTTCPIQCFPTSQRHALKCFDSPNLPNKFKISLHYFGVPTVESWNQCQMPETSDGIDLVYSAYVSVGVDRRIEAARSTAGIDPINSDVWREWNGGMGCRWREVSASTDAACITTGGHF